MKFSWMVVSGGDNNMTNRKMTDHNNMSTRKMSDHNNMST